jgi:hypothetical protein
MARPIAVFAMLRTILFVLVMECFSALVNCRGQWTFLAPGDVGD